MRLPSFLAEEPESSWTFHDIWTYVLLHIEGEPITVRKLVIGMMLLGAGLVGARLAARLTRRAMGARLKHAGAAAGIETLVFYVLLLLFSYSALTVAGVPLTAFTLLGGAAAIGVGFGSQTIISNWIAGLILLVERPIREGDLVQVGEMQGNVVRVGARSTRVMTGDNVEIIVPNSNFLEERIINWTLTSTNVRVRVKLGVAYGSPTDRVKELLLRAVSEHERVHASPEPIVLFTDFGDNALHFESLFWIEMTSDLQRRKIESDLRFGIDQLFRDAGITIAFPQRDVHLDTLRPLDVRVVSPSPGRES